MHQIYVIPVKKKFKNPAGSHPLLRKLWTRNNIILSWSTMFGTMFGDQTLVIASTQQEFQYLNSTAVIAKFKL